MKYAILSDIHGNAEALKSVVAIASAEGVSVFLIAGDFMGYYYRLDKVLDILKDFQVYAIRGNHEDMFVDWLNNPSKRVELERKYGQSFSRNYQILTKEQLNSLTGLPIQFEAVLSGQSVLMCHGTPWEHDEYIYPDAPIDIINRIFDYNKDILIMGHSHYPVIWERDGRYIINPGSVGQPRDRKGGACWALWDSEKKSAALRREKYDVSAVVDDCNLFNPEIAYLKDVLTRGYNS